MGAFTFIDLFAGIGGFHQALEDLGGTCVFASEFHGPTQAIYRDNFGESMLGPIAGDIVPLTEPVVSDVIPAHDLLAAGFPCQPFSKGGLQRGIEEARGTLFFNILKIVEKHRPAEIILENVPNLVGPKHKDTFHRIVLQLRNLGYRVSDTPTIFSPHLLPPESGGAPQIRNRVYIYAKFVGEQEATGAYGDESFYIPNKPVEGWDTRRWNLMKHLIIDGESSETKLPPERELAIAVWSDFVSSVGNQLGRTLPGFPIWEWALTDQLKIEPDTPPWKANFLRKNFEFYSSNRDAIDKWRARNPETEALPASYRKLEWQAGELRDLMDCAIQFRPSGLRAKEPTYLPALVAMNQTSYVGPAQRFISVSEAKRLQSFRPDFDFKNQNAALSMKQLGNAVSVSAVKHVIERFREHYS